MRKLSRIFPLCLVISACGGDDSAGGESSTTDAGSTSTAATTSATTTGTTTSDSSGGVDESTGAPLEGYDDPALWLCHPSKPTDEDQCLANDLTATEILPDGTTQVVEHTVATDPTFDCFYVYPTVDIRFQPGQTENFDDITQELDPLLNQFARFTSICRTFAPLYHQVTIGTFGSAEAPALLDAAYADVLAAFESYLENHAEDRDFVILGHSQGTYMTTRLVQEVIEPDAALRERMIAALLIGGSFSVAPGDVTGGTLTTIPLCETEDQVGCVLAYRTFAADYPPTMGTQATDIPGNDLACTNPASLDGASAKLGGVFFPTFTHQEAVFPTMDFGLDTPFVLYRDFYAASCELDMDGLGFLAIAVDPEPGDVRMNQVDFAMPLFNPSFLGLHVLDYNFAMQELLDHVAAKAAAKGL
jgi:hypothetical protein